MLTIIIIPWNTVQLLDCVEEICFTHGKIHGNLKRKLGNSTNSMIPNFT